MTAKTTNTYACVSPGCALRASTAVLTDTAVIAPAWRNMPRRPEMAATDSGASWRLALLEAGTDIPTPSPDTAAPMDSHAYGENGAGIAISTIPQARIVNPTIIGHRYPVRRSAIVARDRKSVVPTARAGSRGPAPSGAMP